MSEDDMQARVQAMLFNIMRWLAPLLRAAFKQYVETPEGREWVEGIKQDLLNLVLNPGDPIPEARNDGSPG